MPRTWGALAAALLLVATSVATVTAAGSDPFKGKWSAIDADGSRMQVAFSGTGAVRDVSLVDYRATSCGGTFASGLGTGTIAGSEIEVVGLIGCEGTPPADPWVVTFAYDAGDGTLSDGAITWHRGNQRDAFTGVWKATDTDGSAMTLSFGGTGLTRDVAFFDSLASSCDPDASFSGTGTGLIGSVIGDGRFIRVVMVGSCDGSGDPFEGDDKYEYDYVTNTLIGPLEPLEIGGNALPWTVPWHR